MTSKVGTFRYEQHPTPELLSEWEHEHCAWSILDETIFKTGNILREGEVAKIRKGTTWSQKDDRRMYTRQDPKVETVYVIVIGSWQNLFTCTVVAHNAKNKQTPNTSPDAKLMSQRVVIKEENKKTND
jgi:hypothetical protein